ncbi:hypothetical protein POPTR_016G128700v4 [Populus trichocarpa]|uniref:Uncharacterized protein n=1 Tax=Populus trichocarpa TaxID=3694 RepID=U5FLC7_POPTR|nr:uncharacterized protein LOC112324458 [Populus trichocarpa]XP_024442918.1 uncharacterized protein LOC112324458 [Populus trichocarpa]XP_061954077.1 uncharacterized protein LOC133676452 [Populus nigra]XP_061954078.1 uncharacterized protein LOC133676452 [Populus nigra]KAI5561429.1 hypothetical protein BDE02_16G115700 [Populus trichocarpa]PNS99333.1 hypothetical protein POPTR_016G128700v4 [Populus trichocarpa]|eukprot:XP_006374033.1 uncharacterized protein LOC18106344 [Populus trichocarpa]
MGKALSNISKQLVHHHSKKQARTTSIIKQFEKMENSSGLDKSSSNNGTGNSNNTRVPLSDVVSDCIKRWFKDTLKEAKAGDINMQVLVSQMYYSGYGVPKDEQKGRIWMTRASRTRSWVWKVSNKQPGYNASDSDSDSDELKGDS